MGRTSTFDDTVQLMLRRILLRSRNEWYSSEPVVRLSHILLPVEKFNFNMRSHRAGAKPLEGPRLIKRPQALAPQPVSPVILAIVRSHPELSSSEREHSYLWCV
jgi:hypothetical protein